MTENRYCKECKSPTRSYKVGRDYHCALCGVRKGINKETLSKALGWVFILGWVLTALFLILWLTT